MKFNQFVAAGVLATTAAFTQAAPIWQDFSITGLYGENYAFPDAGDNNQQTTATVEYTAKLKYGDFFGFADRTHNDGGNATYFELSPRVSLSAVTGTKLEAGPIKDVLIAGTWEGNSANYSGADFNNYLYGIGFDLAIPYFQYAQLNFYKADNEKGTDDDYQMTFVYGVPFKLGSEDFLVDGFMDWSTGESSSHASELNWTTQWKWNAGKHISPDTRLYLGIEHSVWNNKYGYKGLDQNDVSALVKYHF
jgi:nucleoside-specific outer membrane channel protein Tsx